ncbi:class I SAM-dependent methyltransferase [Variovorax defluvii]|uniref:Class I SAM-dependent methyltransferase n=1 Tax=Variovorax defluvii TaxID=913761 RepID=A0ABP8HDC0_9BURK
MEPDKTEAMLAEVAGYYDGKLALHGESARGVDWNGEAGQVLRFEQLCKVIGLERDFSVNDLGCGYGALCDFLRAGREDFRYTGIDVSEAMIGAARRRYAGEAHVRFVVGGQPDTVGTYGIASGIFNVRLGRSDAEWRRYIESTLEVLDRTSERGFAFNCLTSYSDKDKMRGDLYYADPCELFDLCKRRFARNVALLHDYDLYEFTILVRKAL